MNAKNLEYYKEELRRKTLDLYKQGKWEETIRCFDKALEHDPADKITWNNKGFVLYQQGKLMEAMICYDKALAIDPKYIGALINKGFAFGKQENWEEAMKYYDKAIEFNPTNKEVWNNKGFFLDKQGRLKEAIICYDKALALDPKYITALNNKGANLIKQENWEEAIKCYDRMLEFDPANKEALNNKVVILNKQKNCEEANRFFDKELAPDSINKEMCEIEIKNNIKQQNEEIFKIMVNYFVPINFSKNYLTIPENDKITTSMAATLILKIKTSFAGTHHQTLFWTTHLLLTESGMAFATTKELTSFSKRVFRGYGEFQQTPSFFYWNDPRIKFKGGKIKVGKNSIFITGKLKKRKKSGYYTKDILRLLKINLIPFCKLLRENYILNMNKKCPFCGTLNTSNPNFCMNCGKSLK